MFYLLNVCMSARYKTKQLQESVLSYIQKIKLAELMFIQNCDIKTEGQETLQSNTDR